MSTPTIDIQKEMKGSVLLLKLSGRLDTIASPNTEHQIFDFINSGQQRILLNFQGVEYLSSAGMRMLLSIAKKLKTLSGKLVLCNLSDNVLDVLRMAGFDHILSIEKNQEDALKNF